MSNSKSHVQHKWDAAHYAIPVSFRYQPLRSMPDSQCRQQVSKEISRSDQGPRLLAEEVASAATRAWTAKAPVDVDPLLATIAMTESEDMPDQVRAKLHKITGYVLRDTGRASEAMTHLARAHQLHDGCGVKKDIERLGTAMKKQAIVSR